jgi:O-antigen/teichoic acid export membrane protein
MLPVLGLTGLIRLSAAQLNGLRHVITAQFIEQALAPGLLFMGAVAVFLVGSSGFSPQIAMGLQLASAGATLIIAYFLLAKIMASGDDVTAHPFSGIDLIRRSRPFLLISSSILLAVQLDTVVVNLLLGNEATGIYRVASQGAVLLSACMQVVSTVCLPYFARLHANGDLSNLRRLYRLATAASFIFAAAMFIIFYIEGDALLRLLFGAEFVTAYPILLILSAGWLGSTVFGPSGALMSMSGHERIAAKVFGANAGLNLICGAAAAFFLGVEGVAVVTAATLALNNGVLYFLGRKQVGIR